MLYLSESDIEQLLDMPAAISAMEAAFLRAAAGQIDNGPRTRTRGDGMVLHSMAAVDSSLGLAGWKQYTTTSQGAVFHVGVYEQDSGRPVALIAANKLGQMRTGAVSGLAARLLTAGEVTRMSLIGTGWQAESQLEAVAAACPLDDVIVYGRDRQRRDQFCQRMAQRVGVNVVPVDSAEEAVAQSPLVVTVTTSRAPVFDGAALAPGAVVCAVGSNWLEKTELDDTALSSFRWWVCDNVEACRGEAGELARAQSLGCFSWDEALELSEVSVAGDGWRAAHPGPLLFKSVGLALEDVALAALAVERARENGVGIQLADIEE